MPKFTRFGLLFIGSMAALCGIELQKRRKLNRMAKTVEDDIGLLLAVTRVAQNIRSLLDVEQILQVTINEVVLAFNVEHCIISIEGEDGAAPLVRYRSESPESEADQSLMRDFEACRVALNARSMDHYIRNGGAKSEQAEAPHPLLAVPIVYDDRFLGTLMVRSDNPKRVWRDNELQVFIAVAHQVWRAVMQARLFAEKDQLSFTDALTGCLNRRGFELLLDDALRSVGVSQPVSLVMIDADHFKGINDHYGHAAGDEVLRMIGLVLTEEGVAARWGGEEFILVLPGTGVKEATALAESIRRRFELERVAGIDRGITVSLGVATFPLHASSRGDLLKVVDAALYRAKETGRNRVCVSSELT